MSALPVIALAPTVLFATSAFAATGPGRQCDRAFVNAMWHLDRINARWVTDGEIQVLAIKPNPQLIVQKGLAERFIRYLGLLPENNGRNGRGELRRWLRPGKFFLG